ncbi:MAG: hypothetical protein EBZ67_09040 [Chitinophagia bacterium]|nr:hypothetical protein [Chitinophagia bacterium]
MKVLARELGFLFLFTLISTSLTPSVIDALPLTTEAFNPNRVERIFLVQIGILAFLSILALLYVLRLVVTLVMARFSGGGGEKP